MSDPTTPPVRLGPGPEEVVVKIDGVELAVPKGTNVLEAVRAAGGDISFFCYHPGLSVVAVCRQCLVGIKGQPKLVPACQIPVAPGMEIDNSSAKVQDARRAQLEFTLLNHPIDCPICDKAGECVLQRQYQAHDARPSRADVVKIRKAKVVEVGPHVVLDQERCILCTRCVRVCEEVAGQPQLTMAWRGDHEVLTTAPGERLDNPYSLNTVDVCPVGALTARDFRFQIRAWELLSTPSVCTGCATGCNVEIHHRDNRLYRLVPRFQPRVNRYWMCDEGRFTYQEIAQRRVTDPRIEGVESTWDDALRYVAARVEQARAGGAGKVAVVLSARATCEDNFAAAKLALSYLGAGHVYVAGRPPGSEDAILRHRDKNPNTAGARLIARDRWRGEERLPEDIQAGEVAAVLSLEADVALSPDTASKLTLLAVQTPFEGPLTERAHAVLPAAAWAEVDGTIVNARGMAQRLRRAVSPPGEANPHWLIVSRLARRLGLAVEFTSARAVFAELRAAVPELAEAEFGDDLPPVPLRFGFMRG